ncbi:MAG TPA: nucleotide exchange factor GrpE [Rubellimicrobium sp.]|nr:nucleotide exchange factor GrpE [Rubellimicrobium sp.]
MSDRPDPQTAEPKSLDELALEGDEMDVAAQALEAELESLRAEHEDMRNRLLRALADAENMRKRAERDRKEAEQYGGTKLARDLLPVYDAMSRALETVSEEQRQQNAALLEGIDLTMRELVNVFGRHGMTVIAPQVGDRFDPAVHQAMFEAPLPGTRAGDIIQVATQGFMLHDRLLRPAQVGVSSMPAS